MNATSETEKIRDSERFVERLIDWVRHEAGARLTAHSHGVMHLEITWKEGLPVFAKIGGENVLKPGSVSTFPGETLDRD